MCGAKENSFLEDMIDVVTQVGTIGALGYDADKGGISEGLTTKAVGGLVDASVKGLKDVTGATAAENANKLAREQFEAEQTAALKEREDAKAQTAQEQLSMSRQASSLRSGGARATGSRFSNLGGEERDFLGL